MAETAIAVVIAPIEIPLRYVLRKVALLVVRIATIWLAYVAAWVLVRAS